MKNKTKLKRFLFKLLLFSLIFLFITLIINYYEYRVYTKNFNNKLSEIVSLVKDRYPDISDEELISIFKDNSKKSDFFKDYNIDLDMDSIILENNRSYKLFLIINTFLVIIIICSLLILFLIFNNKRDRELKEITRYIEEINKKNYKLNIDDNSEDELSILKNELYKVTIMLKEAALREEKEKVELKNSLIDISHQLKTPITSILIILDNLISDTDMDSNVRNEFIFDIRKEVYNINFLIQNLLKLSKIDSNTVNFKNDKIDLSLVISEAINRLEMLSELKNIKINFSKASSFINGDFNWLVEAISNIIKNSLEHSNNDSEIDIKIENNKLYTEILIKDYGVGISKKDLNHIFERFYKGKTSSSDSIGIGLALSKSILDRCNAKVIVDSKEGVGTCFVIRFFR